MFVFFLVCNGAKGITASMYTTRKAPEILQVNLNSYIVGDSYCRRKVVKGEESIFVIRIHY
jgi:hypothetical protein